MEGKLKFPHPNYILKANEGVYHELDDRLSVYYLKKAYVYLFSILLLLSICFKDNMFAGIGKTTLILGVLYYLRLRQLTKRELVPSPIELWFYDDYFIIYRKKYWYDPHLQRKQYDKFYYNEIKEIWYYPTYSRIQIFGIVEGVWYDYNKDGTVQPVPSYHKTTDSLDIIYTSMDPSVDFVNELQTRTGVKVELKEALVD